MLTRALARFVCLIAALASTAGAAQAQPRTVIAVDPADKAAAFGADDLSQAVARWRVPVTVVAPAQLARESAPNLVVVTTEGAKLAGQPAVTGLTAQGYAIRRVTAGGTTRWWAIGHDSAGAMYAALELAEAVRIDGHLGNVVERQVNPVIAKRGIKFNIPLDARTPSYSDDSTSGQANIPEMWDMAFWSAVPRRDGAAPLQRAVAVEPEPVSVAGEGARRIRRSRWPTSSARPARCSTPPTRAATCTTRRGRSRRSGR